MPKKSAGVDFAGVDKYEERPLADAKAPEEDAPEQVDQIPDYRDQHPRFVQDKAVDKFFEEQGVTTPGEAPVVSTPAPRTDDGS